MAKRKLLPKPTVPEIEAIAASLVTYHGARVAQQIIDQSYFDDTFPVHIDLAHNVKRTGSGARIVSAISERLMTSNPVVFVAPSKKTEKSIEASLKKSKLLNNWVKPMVDAIEESSKIVPRRGEAYYQLDYNPDYDKTPFQMPFMITSPEPMGVFTSTAENNGVPDVVVKKQMVAPSVIKAMYPNCQVDMSKTEVAYLAYWDRDWRYISCDGQPLVGDGVQENVFHFVPFVHFYSGFGRTGRDQKPEAKAYGRLTPIGVRSILVEECENESALNSIISMWANPFAEFRILDPDVKIDPNDVRNVPITPGMNITTPFGTEMRIHQGTAPPPEMFMHIERIRTRLGLEVPPVTAGVATSSRSSGRLEDVLGSQYAKKYMKLADNMQRALASVLSMALRAGEATGEYPVPYTSDIYDADSGKTISKADMFTAEDLDKDYNCRVELRSNDEFERDQNFVVGERLLNSEKPVLSTKQFLMQYRGLTAEEAEDTINETIAERALWTNPMFSEMIVKEAMKKVGLDRLASQLDEQEALQGEQQAVNQAANQPRTFDTPEPGNIDRVRDVLDGPRPPRNSPQEG